MAERRGICEGCGQRCVWSSRLGKWLHVRTPSFDHVAHVKRKAAA